MLTSLKNPKVAAAVRLKKRAYRDEDRRFLVEGAQGVREALEEPGALRSVYATDALDPCVARADQAGIETHLVSDDLMRKLTSTVTPQGVVGVATYLDVPLEALGGDGCVAILHEVRDPGNAGTVLRSADAAGADGVVFTTSSVDVYNPKTVRASAGSVFHLPVVRDVAADTAVDVMRARGLRVLAMTPNGEEDLFRTDLSGGVAFVFGNEARGLPDEMARNADATVRVPQAGRAESLNLAAAASVCLFEWRRRLARGSEALESLISAAAHDIRSPLTAMKGFGYALEKRWGDMGDDQRTLMLRGIVHDADRMDTILRQLVDAARIVDGTLEIFREQVDVGELVGSIAQNVRRDTDHPEVEWLGDAGVVFADPPRLRTTILAFVESLVWWGREGPVRIEGHVRGGLLSLSAARGPTELDDAAARELFTPRRPGQGAGSKIGLFVARGVAEAQGGRAWADVRDGHLRFHLELPIDSAS